MSTGRVNGILIPSSGISVALFSVCCVSVGGDVCESLIQQGWVSVGVGELHRHAWRGEGGRASPPGAPLVGALSKMSLVLGWVLYWRSRECSSIVLRIINPPTNAKFRLTI